MRLARTITGSFEEIDGLFDEGFVHDNRESEAVSHFCAAVDHLQFLIQHSLARDQSQDEVCVGPVGIGHFGS